MNKRFTLLFIILLSIFQSYTFCQTEEKVGNIIFSADFANRWIFRGINNSDVPVIQPTLGYEAGGFKTYVWSSYSIGQQKMQEIDFCVQYKWKSLTFSVIDYFNMTDSVNSSHDFCNLNGKKTMHTFDAIVQYTGPESFPIEATASYWLFGNDRDAQLKNYHSTYLELAYPFNYKAYTLRPFAAGTLSKGYYGDKPGLVNVGFSVSKRIPITEKFALPTTISLITNPIKENVYMTFIFTLQ